MAFEFYKSVASGSDPRVANISLTGHSLGGGLGGLVGAVYNKNGIFFDSMAYTIAATNTLSLSATNSSLKKLVYGTSTPWAFSHAGLLDIELTGQLLEMPFIGQDSDIEYDLGFVPWGNLTTVELHSMATLILAMYGDLEAGPNWEAAPQYFWPLLYDDTFANSIGVTKTSVLGGDTDGGDYASALRQILAYSAIDEGDNTTTIARPFGDTGIVSLFDDANDLGRILKLSTVPAVITAQAANISALYVQYAGLLALNKVLQWDNYAAKNGILATSYYGEKLGIDLSAATWEKIKTGAAPLAETRASLVAALINETGEGAAISSKMASLWGNSSGSIIDYISISTMNTPNNSSLIGEVTPGAGRANLYLGTTGVNSMIGSTGNDLILGLGGDDYLSTQGGRDIVFGGAGSDFISAEGGLTSLNGSYYDGGAGTDSLIYNATNYGIRINGAAKTITGIGSGTQQSDTYANIEQIHGTRFRDEITTAGGVKEIFYAENGNDLIYGRGSASYLDGDTLSGDTGYDTIDYSNVDYGLTYIDSSVYRTGYSQAA